MISSLPIWLAYCISFLLVLSGIIVCISGIGYYFFHDFFRRLHLSSFVMSGGMGAIVLATALYFGFQHSYLFFKFILIFFFMLFSAPISAMLLSAMGLYRYFETNYVQPMIAATKNKKKHAARMNKMK